MLPRLPGGKDFLVTDVGKWDGPGGKVLRITAARSKPCIITPVLTGLYMPHHMAFGPDSKVMSTNRAASSLLIPLHPIRRRPSRP